MTGRNGPDFNILYAVFDTLIDFEPKTLELRPGLAKAWKFVDPKTFVVDLVEGVRFHDGSVFDAEAVKFNIERCKHEPRSNVKADLTTVDSVHVSAPNQVTFKLNRPNSGFPTMLTDRIGCMVSPLSVKQFGPNVDRNPVGTGPFKFVEWKDNVSFKLIRNPDYWRPGLPYLDGIDVRLINELNTLIRSVVADEADVGTDLFVQQRLIADRASHIVTVTSPALTFWGAFLNYSKPPLDDVRIRKALNYALNRDDINRVVMFGHGEPTSAVLSRTHWACDPATANYYEHDVAKAKQLLAEAGHPNGIDIEAFGWSDQLALQRQELLVSQWAKAGIRVKVSAVAPQQGMQFFNVEGKLSMSITPTGGFPDPSQFYEALFGKDALRNAGRVELPGFRELLNATMETSDQSQRKAAFAKLQRFVVENALQVPQVINVGTHAHNRRVKNYVLGLRSAPKFHDVWIEA
jgi:ABC-type transport system substrate-binding protein